MTDGVYPTVKRFSGFPDRMELVPIPSAIFGTLLREIDDLAELKTLLYILRLLHGQPRAPRFVQRSRLLADGGLLEALGGTGQQDGDAVIGAAVARAVARGTLLAIRVTDGGADEECYLLNTRANQRTVQQVLDGERTLGEFGPMAAPRGPAEQPDRPSIYELYEQNIGLLTPLLADELREAAEQYPDAWIEDAFREAVAQNKRNWRYVMRILETWSSRGRGTSGTTGRRPDPPKTSGDLLESRYGLIRR